MLAEFTVMLVSVDSFFFSVRSFSVFSVLKFSNFNKMITVLNRSLSVVAS